jgi:hypothetical protein
VPAASQQEEKASVSEKHRGIGDNRGPIIPPTDTEFLADLQSRYPEIAKRLTEFEAALAEFPEKLSLADEETAAALQDLLGQIKKDRARWKADKAEEKKPWNSLIKIIGNFFEKAEEKADGWLEKWRPVHQQFLDLKAAENERKAREEAERQRAEAERLRREAEEAAERQRQAEEAERLAREREVAARLEAEAAERRKVEAEQRAEAARAESARIEREKRERERVEQAEISEQFKLIRAAMKSAEVMHGNVCDDEDAVCPPDLLALIAPGGEISRIGAALMRLALSDDQRKDVLERRERLDVMRAFWTERLGAKERKKQEKERREAEARDAEAAAERKRQREADEAATVMARAAREAAEAEAAQAKLDAKTAKKDVKNARTAGLDAYDDQKEAGRDAKRLGTDADRTANRADRIDRRITQGTDTPLRGDLGTVGSNTGRWVYDVTDRDALLATLGPLAAYLMEDAINAAVYRWMRAHQGEFEGERVEGRLAGCTFAWERSTRIA